MKRGLLLLRRLRWVAAFVVVGACVDPISFDASAPAAIIVLDGAISTAPGPYVIGMSRGLPLDSDSTLNAPVAGATIVLHSEDGETESFVETKPGEYSTGGVIRGVVGGTYHVTITMPDGATFASAPETIMPSGQITDIRYQFEARTVEKSFGTVNADVFNVFIDADAGQSDSVSFVRWRFNGVYEIGTNPELHTTWIQGEFYYKTPFECSGFVVDPAIGGGALRQDAPCTCCTCYVTAFESAPRLSDTDVVADGKFSNVKITEIPITRMTFYKKYRVSIEQMTISKNAFDFFKIIRTQKDGASNLFQPPPGKIVGNIMPVNADYQIIGLFWGASITSKAISIADDAVPYKLPADVVPFPCTYYGNATTVKPEDWDE